MKNSARAHCCAALMPLMLMGCAALDTVHYAWPGPGRSDVITVDAKQRHLIMATDRNGNNFRACAEAAPDAFTAFGSSFSLGGLFGATSNEVKAANAFATTAATIERTQTINLLRESFYRTCERLLNRDIDQSQFAILAARDHRSMVAILAVEQLTGVVKAPATVISGPAVQSLVADTSKLVDLLSTYQAERAAAEKQLEGAQTALKEVDKPVTVNGNSVQACSLDSRPEDAAAAAAFDICSSKKEAVEAAKEKLATAAANEKGVRTNLGALAGGISAATQAGHSNFGGLNSSQRVSDATMEKLAATVGNIAMNAGIDEALMFCVGYLNNPNNLGSTRTACNGVVVATARQDAVTKGALVQTSSAAAAEILDSLNVAELDVTAQTMAQISGAIAKQIEDTPSKELPARIVEFEKAVGVSSGLATICDTMSVAECAKIVRDGYYAGFGLSQSDHLAAVGQALQKWAAK